MAIDINKDISYQLSINVLKALGGDTSKDFQSVEEVWDEINKIYDNAGDRLDIEALIMDIRNNGLYEFYPNENADAYAPVRINVNIPQKYTDEYVEQLGREAFNEGKIEGEEIGYQKGFAEGSDDGYQDGYSEGLDDGAEEQKSLMVEATIRGNGVYEREDGYRKVTVDVTIPTFETEQLSVELTENGDYNYTPSKDGYDSVSVSVNVPTSEPADLRDLIVEVKENKEYEFLPTDYDGWKKVNLTVSVPTGGGGGGVDLTAIGYTQEESDFVNNAPYEWLEYSKIVKNDWDTAATKHTALSKHANRLRYCPSLNMTGISGASAENLFAGFASLLSVPAIDTSNLTSLGSYSYSGASDHKYGFFGGCKSLISVPHLNTSKVKTMSGTFNGCENIKTIPSLDTSSCTSLNGTFAYCRSLESLPYIDTSNCISLGYAFYYCNSLKNINELNTDKVTSLQYTFSYCKNLKSISFTNTSKVTNMAGLFNGCESLVNISGLDTSISTNCRDFFKGCKSLVTLPYCDFTKTTYFPSYSDCVSLVSIPDIDCPAVSSSNGLSGNFANCTCDIPNISIPLVTNTNSIFANYKGVKIGNLYCPKATSVILGLSKSGSNISFVETIGEIDCSACTTLTIFADYATAYTDTLKNVGGFKNLGKASGLNNVVNNSNGLVPLSGLTHESMMNIINGLYDRASAGYAVKTIKFNPTPFALLTDEEKAIGTNKGWTLTT